jgi:hypothetical protein
MMIEWPSRRMRASSAPRRAEDRRCCGTYPAASPNQLAHSERGWKRSCRYHGEAGQNESSMPTLEECGASRRKGTGRDDDGKSASPALCSSAINSVVGRLQTGHRDWVDRTGHTKGMQLISGESTPSLYCCGATLPWARVAMVLLDKELTGPHRGADGSQVLNGVSKGRHKGDGATSRAEHEV